MHVTGQPEKLLVAEQLQKIAAQELNSGLECTNPGQIRPGAWTRTTRKQLCSGFRRGNNGWLSNCR